MWFSAIKLAVQAGSHIYKNKQKTKMLMADAQMNHAQKMADGQAEYQGKLLESRNSDWKDEFILLLLSAPIVLLAWAVFSDDAVEKMSVRCDSLSDAGIDVDAAKVVFGAKALSIARSSRRCAKVLGTAWIWIRQSDRAIARPRSH